MPNPPHDTWEMKNTQWAVLQFDLLFPYGHLGPDFCNKNKQKYQHWILEKCPVFIYSKKKKKVTCFIVSAQQCSGSSPPVVLMLPWSATIDCCDGIVIELPIVAGPLTLCGSSSVSELPESHYSKLVILAPRQLSSPRCLCSVPSSHKAESTLLRIWLKTVRLWIRYT